MSNERRKHNRCSVKGIQGNILYLSDLKVLNISIDGASIETTRRIDVNREYTFQIGHKDMAITIRGRVVWALLTYKEKKGTGEIIPLYRAGIQFADTLDEKKTALLNFITDSKINTLEKRVGGVRFKITDDKNIKINYPYQYEVKKISLSGMLIETDSPLDLNSQHDIELFLNIDVLHIKARIAHCEMVQGKNITKYNVGIEFVNLSENDQKLLKKVIDAL